MFKICNVWSCIQIKIWRFYKSLSNTSDDCASNIWPLKFAACAFITSNSKQYNKSWSLIKMQTTEQIADSSQNTATFFFYSNVLLNIQDEFYKSQMQPKNNILFQFCTLTLSPLILTCSMWWIDLISPLIFDFYLWTYAFTCVMDSNFVYAK